MGDVVLNIRDITERKTLENQLRHQAFHDALTGLANRALFADRLAHARTRQARTGEPLGVVIIDLDDFKSINDSLGHGAGDRLLADVAGRLGSCVRASDTLARLGGDEFAVLLEDAVDSATPAATAERILAAFEADFDLDGRSLPIRASVGVAFAGPETASAEDLIRDADVAMYIAKERGKGGWTMFKPDMQLVVHERLQLKADLACALNAGDELMLHYQPIVDLETRQVVGAEALIRWNHAQRGLLSPAEFLPVAEDSGLIVPLGRWVLHEACAQACAWQRHQATPFRIAVNVSGRQVDDPGLIADVTSALATSGLEPADLTLEITESVLMRDTDHAVDVLERLKALGVQLAIDDFGTGYSSLGYLQRFPIDVIKVDRSFVADLDSEHKQAALSEAVVKIGRALNLPTVAEGIETPEQLERLRSLLCELGQGFLFAKPASPADFEAYLDGTALNFALVDAL